ncbi:MAG: histidine phosphatase family protein [Thermoanaerobaculia bacterium]|nr:histidine phosphatase family protein [Thermoanaerobaculia bacterium]
MRLLAFVLSFALSGSLAADSLTTVILVRHAEKVDASADPELAAAGVERSAELARILADVPLSAIYTTPFKRTRNTAAPIAAACRIEATVIAAGKTLAADIAAKILSEQKGKTVLVVGHSNTVPDTMRALGVKSPPPIDDATEFDRLFVVTIGGDGEPRLLSMRYGKKAP